MQKIDEEEREGKEEAIKGAAMANANDEKE